MWGNARGWLGWALAVGSHTSRAQQSDPASPPMKAEVTQPRNLGFFRGPCNDAKVSEDLLMGKMGEETAWAALPQHHSPSQRNPF